MEKDNEKKLEPNQVLHSLNFGRVDAESDNRFENCFIGTDMLRHTLRAQHSLVLGSKGSGKSAAFRLLCTDKERLRPLFPRNFEDVFPIPVYGLYNEEYVYGSEFREMKSDSIDEFRYFWLMIIGLRAVTTIAEEPKIRDIVAKSKNQKLKDAYKTLQQVFEDLSLEPDKGAVSKLKQRVMQLVKPSMKGNGSNDPPQLILAEDFKHRTGMSVTAVMDKIDTILQEINCTAWLMLDKLDLLFIDDFEKLKSSITGLVQLLIEQSNRFKNIHFKIFLRSDIYRQLRIVNKSHLISYTSEMKWSDSLLLKLLVSRAVADPNVRAYCEEQTGMEVTVADIINGTDEDVLGMFYVIFESTMDESDAEVGQFPFVHSWMLKHLTDGMGNVYPREQIHLGNLAVEKQLEMNRKEGEHSATRLIGAIALKEAFAHLSIYRCDTYLYSEFPHLTKHFDVFRGSPKVRFTRDELNKLFEKLTPNGDEGIRSVHDTGLLTPNGRSVDSSMEFSIPLLYRIGLGVAEKDDSATKGDKSDDSILGLKS
ncbi:MAG: hypothetical protein C0417_11920 [Chlorobiaceae bacterium]|nr:hypothetical protein [Chlorobiaceae bacterium]